MEKLRRASTNSKTLPHWYIITRQKPSMREIVKSAAAEGDASIANCYSTKNVSQDSSRNFIFKDMDAAKAWLSECVAAINNFNNNAESDPIIKVRQKSEEII
jgi:hypothetical protein